MGGDSVLFVRYTGGDSVLVNKKEWGGGGGYVRGDFVRIPAHVVLLYLIVCIESTLLHVFRYVWTKPTLFEY